MLSVHVDSRELHDGCSRMEVSDAEKDIQMCLQSVIFQCHLKPWMGRQFIERHQDSTQAVTGAWD